MNFLPRMRLTDTSSSSSNLCLSFSSILCYCCCGCRRPRLPRLRRGKHCCNDPFLFYPLFSPLVFLGSTFRAGFPSALIIVQSLSIPLRLVRRRRLHLLLPPPAPKVACPLFLLLPLSASAGYFRWITTTSVVVERPFLLLSPMSTFPPFLLLPPTVLLLVRA